MVIERSGLTGNELKMLHNNYVITDIENMNAFEKWILMRYNPYYS